MSPRLVFAYRYGAFGGPTSQLLARLDAFGSHFDTRVLFERDLGAVAAFPPNVATVAATFEEQVDAIGALQPDWFVVFDSGWREAWIRAGSPGKLVLEVRTTSSNLTYLDELRAAQRIDLIIVATQYLASFLIDQGLGDIAPIAVVPNVLRSAWFEPAEPWVAPKPIVLWVGRLEPHKGVLPFIDLCGELESMDVIPMLVGGVNDTNEEIAVAVERLYSRPRRNVPLWFPRVTHDRMRRIYASAAASGGLLVITSRNENFPNTVAEASMMGCPVVAPAIGGIPELLPETALFPPGDFATARGLVESILSVPGAGARIVERARGMIEPLVRPDRALSAYLAALERAL
ncbi:MAG TPA: glycosyltransferase family 4 protein [Actinomycetota bacterium]|nr:glycosyltransferase family 4 protein [Actinomycetota bacterium]